MSTDQLTRRDHTRGDHTARDLTARGVSPLHSGAIFAGRSLRHSLRDGEGIVMAIVLPLTLMLMFTYIFGGAILGPGYLDYVVPGVLVLCATQGAASVAAAVSRDLSTGVMNRFRTLPIASATALVGHVAASMVRNLIGSSVVLGVALLLGYRPTGGALSLLAALGLMMIYILTITAIMATIGLISGSPENAAGYGFLFFILPYVSSGFVPVQTMPGWLQVFAANQPYTLVIETLRGFLQGTPVSPGVGIGALAWCVGLIIACGALCGWLFPRKITR